jgi:hypothetical protein
MSTRLFRSIVVYGTAMGACTAVVSGCDLYFRHEPPQVDAGQIGIIDAGPYGMIEDGPWGIIDASAPPDSLEWPRDAGAMTKPDGAPDCGSGSDA